jgi:hypothetical protein
MLVWITVAITLLSLVLYWLFFSWYGELIATANARRLVTNPARPTLRNPYLALGDGMMVFVSVAVLCSSLIIILSGRYGDASQKWAYGSVGSIVGFWCRRSK